MADQELPLVDKEIDHLYVTTNWLIATRNSPDIDHVHIKAQFLNQLREQSTICRNHQNAPQNYKINYDDYCDEEAKGEDAFDWFGPLNLAPNHRPLLIVYLHGGYWQSVELSEASHWADPVTNAGAMFVSLSYRLAPYQDLKSMPHQLCKGMQKVFQYTINQISGRSNENNLQICLVGHSAGVQLALEMLHIASKDDVSNQAWFSAVKYLILISGVYDLRPIVHTSINRALKLRTVDEAWALSPERNFIGLTPSWVNKPIQWLVVWAQYDSPALIKQSETMVKHLESCIKTDSTVETFTVGNADHFTSIGELFYGPGRSQLMKKILEFVGLIETKRGK